MTSRTLRATIAGAAFAAISPFAASLPTPLDDCLGCNKLASAEVQESETVGNCTIILWRETSGFTEECGDSGIVCDKAKCEYDWELKYKTQGTGCGSLALYLFQNNVLVEDGSYGESSASVSLDAGSWGPKNCGRQSAGPQLYSLRDSNDPQSSNVVVSIAYIDGCTECEAPGSGA